MKQKTTLSVAWYVGPPKDWQDWVVRLVQGRCTHCELVFGQHGSHICCSASGQDGGIVRTKQFPLDNGHWEVLPLTGLSSEQVEIVRRWAFSQLNKKYDWWGVFMGFLANHTFFSWFMKWVLVFLGLPWQRDDKFFCSEFVACALNCIVFPKTPALPAWSTPQQLKSLLERLTTGAMLFKCERGWAHQHLGGQE